MSEHLDYELSALIDGDLEGAERVRAEAHLLDCAACREALEDLRRVVRRAAALHDAPPARDLWPGIAARLAPEPAAEVVPLASRRRRISFAVPQLAAAALALMALSAAAGALLLRPAATPVAVAPATRAAAPAAPVNERIGRVVSSYETHIAELERVLAQHRGSLDTATVRTLEQSLRIIDSAIVQARSALARDPRNIYLNGALQRALDRKLDVLRQVTLTVAS